MTPRTPLRLAAAALTIAALASCSGSSSDENTAASMSAPEAVGDAGSVDAYDTGAVELKSKAAKGDAATGALPATSSGTTAAATGSGAAVRPGAASAGASAPVPADIAAGADRKTAKGVSVPDAALVGRDVIYTADLSVQVDDVTKAASQIESAVRAAGGYVEGSERSTEAAPAPVDGAPVAEPGRSAATLTLRIPPGVFTSVLDRIAELGLVVDRNLTGKDVTEAVVDVKSRISSARTSVERIRDLMDRAVTLRDVVALEGELSQREADLDALLAKQASLKNQISLATVTVRLEPTKAAEEAAAADDDRGFGAGLSDGWDAFSDAAIGGATVVGALVPFAAALLILGPLAWWIAVRIHRTAPQLRRKVSQQS